MSIARPTSQVLVNHHISGLNILRDQQSLATWLLVGATIQCLLFYLPYDPRYVVLPTLALATLKALQAIVTVSTYNPGNLGIEFSKPMYAKLDAVKDSTGGVCVLLLGLKINQ